MTDEPLVTYIIITMRSEEATEAIQSCLDQDYQHKEIVVVATTETGTYDTLVARFADEDLVRVYEERERRGPPAARNRAIALANGDILVSIDDDAILRSESATRKVVDEMVERPEVGALSFRSVEYGTDRPISIEIPRGPDGKIPSETYLTTYFVAVGAAFRAEAFDAVDGFPGEFFYYKEELDLSFQLLKAGYEILYYPKVVVEHKQSGAGRPTANRQWELTLQNRIRVSIRHLPIWHLVVSTLVWTLFTLYKTRLSLSVVVEAYASVIRDRSSLLEQRDVIDAETRRRIAELNGRLWY